MRVRERAVCTTVMPVSVIQARERCAADTVVSVVQNVGVRTSRNAADMGLSLVPTECVQVTIASYDSRCNRRFEL